MCADDQGLFCPVAFMGAPTIVNEKLVAGDETQLALQIMKQALASGLFGPGSDEGKSGNEKVSVKKHGDVWIASCDDLKKIDINSKAGVHSVS